MEEGGEAVNLKDPVTAYLRRRVEQFWWSDGGKTQVACAKRYNMTPANVGRMLAEQASRRMLTRGNLCAIEGEWHQRQLYESAKFDREGRDAEHSRPRLEVWG